MLHEDALTLLNPVSALIESADPALEGAALDIAAAAITALQAEIYPSGSTLLLSEWETLFELVPAAGATLAARRALVVSRLITRGDIKKPHYLVLAAALGYTIRIEDYIPPIIGYFAIGDELVYEPWQDFSAAVSGAGDSLGMGTEPALLPACWRVIILAGPLLPAPDLEAMLLDLAPAHIKMNFIYLEV